LYYEAYDQCGLDRKAILGSTYRVFPMQAGVKLCKICVPVYAVRKVVWGTQKVADVNDAACGSSIDFVKRSLIGFDLIAAVG
jgi:hypothetical protein